MRWNCPVIQLNYESKKKKEPLKDDSLNPSSGQLQKFLQISPQLFTLSLSVFFNSLRKTEGMKMVQ
jgi:hypothetical protein